MLNSLKLLLLVRRRLMSRSCSGFVSRMRFLNRLKEDDLSCAEALQDSHLFLFHRLSPLLNKTKAGTFTPAVLHSSDVRLILERLGCDRSLLKDSVLIGCSKQKQAQFCLDVGELDQAAVEEACSGTFVELRKSFFLLTGPDAPLLAKGQALLRWHHTHRFSSATGGPTQRNQAGSQRVCSSSGTVYYPTMSPVVIVLVSDGSRCVLARQASFPPGMFSALAGFCDMGETVEEALSREVAEEVGLEVESASYSSSQHWPFPDSSFMLGCHASVSPAHLQLDVDHTELEDARWFSLQEIISALQVQTPPRRGHTPHLWLPPKHAIGHRLITEWVELQQGRKCQ